MSAPRGSSTPTFVSVSSITVLMIFPLNCGSLKTQLAFKDLIFSLIIIILLAEGGNSGLSNIDHAGFKLYAFSKY